MSVESSYSFDALGFNDFLAGCDFSLVFGAHKKNSLICPIQFCDLVI